MPQRTRTHSQTCSVEGCDNEVRARSWCAMHYNRWFCTGTVKLKPRHLGFTFDQAVEKFWSKVDMSAGPDSCWEWIGYRHPSGYGYFTSQWFSTRRTHRIAWELARGPVPEGLVLDHLCRNRACVNPDHLEPVTVRENTLRGESYAAEAARRTCCRYGHAYTPENTYVTSEGARACNTCRRNHVNERRSRARKAARHA